jgi:pSer/pThr/pTyr-binding forkhead associated (FHA) protein
MEERTIVDPGGPGAPYGDATQVIGSQPGPGMDGTDRTQQAVTATCPVCRTPNPPVETYCQDCGLLLSSAPADVEPLPDISQLPRFLDSTGKEFLLNPGVNSVGRDAADLLLVDGTVSRRHAQVTLEEGVATVEDLGSTNGTSVNGERLAPGDRRRAYDGDTVKFGSLSLTLALPGGAARAEAPPGSEPEMQPEAELEQVAALLAAGGQEIPLFAGVNTIGRRSTNRIAIQDSFASGKHAEIICTPEGEAELVDVGSTNGTFVTGERLTPNQPLALVDGTVLTVGKTQFTFRRGQGDAASSASEDVEDDDFVDELDDMDVGGEPMGVEPDEAAGEPAAEALSEPFGDTEPAETPDRPTGFSD